MSIPDVKIFDGWLNCSQSQTESAYVLIYI